MKLYTFKVKPTDKIYTELINGTRKVWVHTKKHIKQNDLITFRSNGKEVSKYKVFIAKSFGNNEVWCVALTNQRGAK